MCGRFTLHTPLDEVLAHLHLPSTDLEYVASYNIAPTQQVVAVAMHDQPKAVLMRWGLGERRPPIINARLESLTEKRTFRPLVENFRCLILADGFYEWQKVNSHKQPYYITLSEKQPFAFAGLYQESPEASCTIITMDARGPLQELHHRMPVILQPEQINMWLGIVPFAKLRKTILDSPEVNLVFQQVDPIVNSPRYNEPRCIEPFEHRFEQGRLFE